MMTNLHHSGQLNMPEPKLDALTMHPFEAIFSWNEPGTDNNYHWAADQLCKYLADTNHEVVLIPIDKDFARTLPALRGLEIERMDRIPLNPNLWTPVVLLNMPDGTHLLVDGNHRYFMSWVFGETEIRTWMVDQDIWEKFLVKLPEWIEEGIKGKL